MNAANKITVFRFLLPILFIPALLTNVPYGNVIALSLFLLGSLSDWIDGYIARRYNMQTDFGRLMDPLADKILVSSALVCFVALHEYPYVKAWMVVVIIGRDFLVTGLRSLALKNNTVISAHTIGKHKTAWQMAGIVTFLVFLALMDIFDDLPPFLQNVCSEYAPHALSLLFYAITLLTFISGCVYLVKYRHLYMNNV
jgi:CDP-diacylglycerol---glycerol-3-phosphate 3-phosphatidyltransferase